MILSSFAYKYDLELRQSQLNRIDSDVTKFQSKRVCDLMYRQVFQLITDLKVTSQVRANIHPSYILSQ